MPETETDKVIAPIFGISRLRMGTDGSGVTTLVTFMGCPLKCRYCLNEKCHEPIFKSESNTPRDGILLLSPQTLYNRIKIDNIYFCATGGGVCFGGGEPALQWKFIKAFRAICGDKWKITIETCLHYPEDIIRELSAVVDYWIIDVKSLDPEIFEKYTEVPSIHLSRSLEVLRNIVDSEKVTIKIPLIPKFNSENDVKQSFIRMKDNGFRNIKRVKYIRRPLKK